MLCVCSFEKKMQPYRSTSAMWALSEFRSNLRSTDRKRLQGSPDFPGCMKTSRGPSSYTRRRKPPLLSTTRGSPRTESRADGVEMVRANDGNLKPDATVVCPTCSLQHAPCHVCGPAMACAFRHTTIPPRHKCHHCGSAWYISAQPTQMTQGHTIPPNTTATTNPDWQDCTTRLMIADSLLYLSRDEPTVCTEMGSGQVKWMESEQEPCRTRTRATSIQLKLAWCRAAVSAQRQGLLRREERCDGQERGSVPHEVGDPCGSRDSPARTPGYSPRETAGRYDTRNRERIDLPYADGP